MFIGGSDKETTVKNIMRFARKSRFDYYYGKIANNGNKTINTMETDSLNSSSDLEICPPCEKNQWK